MSMKIRVSFEHPSELKTVLDRLGDLVTKQSKPEKTGRFTRVYLTVGKPEKA